jgi:diguanylate cyclase (GGDEF)-like protein
VVTLPESERRQAKLLAWILLFILLFSIAILFTILVFNPHHDPDRGFYCVLIIGLIALFTFAYGLNRHGHYNIAAILLVASAAFAPWASLLIDPSIFHGDFVPLVYFTFSVLLSSILLPTYTTIILAALQFAGLTLVLLFSSATSALNWFSLLAYVFLTSVFSILANSIIQSNMKRIESQAHQLTLNEALLREQSIRDDLTHLFNRRYLTETLNRETQRAARKKNPLGIIMLDVDNFKHINDTLGHVAGDTVLLKLGQFIAEHVRESDVACRYGGDEFALVLPDASRETATARAEQLRDGVKNVDVPVAITISLGIAVFPDNGMDGETLLKSVDSALYQAKHDGGNCVVVAG